MPRHGPTNTASPCFRWSLTLPRIIEAAPPGPGHYQFGHALIQEAIYEDISPVRRAREHGRTAETIERLHRLDLDDHAAALAHHFTRAGGIDSTQKVARYSLITGEHALNLKTPFYGSRKMKAWLLQQGYLVSRKRVRRLMRLS